jgi:hypothetical protein
VIPLQDLAQTEGSALAAILNGTLVALFKTYYGRFAGTEGNLKTEVVDVNLLDVPDPRGAPSPVLEDLSRALKSMQGRQVGHLVESAFMDCHSAEAVQELADRPVALSEELRQPDRRALDDAVFRLLGVQDPAERQRLLDELYHETAAHYRRIRIVEVQKMEQRAGGRQRRLRAEDLAEPIWNGLPDDQKGPPVLDWLARLSAPKAAITIPEGKATVLGPDHMLDPCGVDFRAGNQRVHMNYASPEQAALAGRLANLGVRGPVEVPAESAACREALAALNARLSAAEERFREAAEARTGDERLHKQAADLLMHWFVHARPGRQA